MNQFSMHEKVFTIAKEDMMSLEMVTLEMNEKDMFQIVIKYKSMNASISNGVMIEETEIEKENFEKTCKDAEKEFAKKKEKICQASDKEYRDTRTFWKKALQEKIDKEKEELKIKMMKVFEDDGWMMHHTNFDKIANPIIHKIEEMKKVQIAKIMQILVKIKFDKKKAIVVAEEEKNAMINKAGSIFHVTSFPKKRYNRFLPLSTIPENSNEVKPSFDVPDKKYKDVSKNFTEIQGTEKISQTNVKQGQSGIKKVKWELDIAGIAEKNVKDKVN